MTPQQKASDPNASAWVAASAGTGKTRVLTDRVLRLLLDGTPPERILCLTFTKAAASEIAIRTHDRLSEWATVPEPALAGQLGDLCGETADADRLARARGLFATVLDAAEGVRIKTIHAFCESLLSRFPLEAGLAPHFTVMDARTTEELLTASRDVVLARAQPDDPSPLTDALAQITRRLTEVQFSAIMAELARQRGRLNWLFSHYGGRAGLLEEARRRLGVALVDAGQIVAEACRDEAFDRAALEAGAAALQQGSKSDHERGRQIAGWLADAAARPAGFDAYLAQYFTKEGFYQGQGKRRVTLATKQTLDGAPEAVAALEREADRLGGVRDRIRAAEVLAATDALLVLGEALLDVYDSAKARHAVLDYDDLILLTRALLRQKNAAPWVLYKLDGGLDHILIDEAQDTSPDQWEVVAALADEFFAGAGAREARRTIFAVGDAKQSIFSFQGADPRTFSQWREHFAARVGEAAQLWQPVDLALSFRSTRPILETVDRVFAQPAARDGLLDGGAIHHLPERASQAGRVELWSLEGPQPAAETEAWAPPISPLAASSPSQRLAHRIGQCVAGWLARGERLDSRDRPIRPGDIMILVQRRSGFVDNMVRALKHADVPVAGVDRMVVTDQLAVMDLIALGRFLLLPDDDLTLAAVLKSPLIGFDEAALFDLAYARGAASLWRTLAVKAGERPQFAAAHDTLAGLLGATDVMPPYEFYSQILGAGGGRRRLLARLGTQANDPIDELLALALAFEHDHVPSLEGFLHWLEARRAEVKRDFDIGRDEVRVMTVHGAKGLQAPIVFLPDTCRVPLEEPSLLWLGGEQSEVMLWPPRRALEDPLSAEARAAARRRRDEEHRRLLYVALTRAEDRLYVCGWHSRPTITEGCWYHLFGAAFRDIAEPMASDNGRQDYRLEARQQGAPDKSEAAGPAHAEPAPLPAWVGRAPPPEPAPVRPLLPSRLDDDEPAARSPVGAGSVRRNQRGRLVHLLLQHLPELPEEERRGAARRYLAAVAGGLDGAAREAILRETLAVLEDPAFAPIFAAGSRAEVALSGRIGERVIAARVDRLWAGADEVFVVDYKTNRAPPASADEVPPAYLRQMAAYRALLTEIFPSHTISCGILWTDGPILMKLSDSALASVAL